MKKNLFFIAIILLLLGCNSNNSLQNPDSTDIYGEWYMVDYIDSAVAHKKIYNYSNDLASIAIKIAIKRQSYEFLGSVGYIDSAYIEGFHEIWNDTISRIDKYNYQVGGTNDYHIKLSFVDNGNGLKLFAGGCNPRDKQNKSPKNYEFRKIKNIDDVEQYLAKNIFAGKYYDSLSGKTIVLGEDLSLQGIDSLEKYSIQLDFMEMGPGMDMIMLNGSNNKKGKYLNWRFENNKLILSSIIELYNNNSDANSEMGENYLGAKVDKVEYVWNKIE